MYIRTASSLSKRQLFTSSFSVCLAHIVSRRRLVRLHHLVRCPHLSVLIRALYRSVPRWHALPLPPS